MDKDNYESRIECQKISWDISNDIIEIKKKITELGKMSNNEILAENVKELLNVVDSFIEYSMLYKEEGK